MLEVRRRIDEAGRGPVLGPMVMAALAIKEEDIKRLEWLGVKDSKLLSSSAREELFERIREVIHDFRVEVVEPDAIDLSIAGEPDSNLNWLEADTAARMVSELDPDQIILGSGTDEIIEIIGKTFFKSGDNIVVSRHAFIRYKMAGDLMGCKVTSLPRVTVSSITAPPHHNGLFVSKTLRRNNRFYDCFSHT